MLFHINILIIILSVNVVVFSEDCSGFFDFSCDNDETCLYSGFQCDGDIDCFDRTDEHDCDNLKQCGGNLTALTGNIISPNYPFPYPSNSKCTWIIHAPANTKIVLRFLHFSLQSPSIRNTCYDWFLIFEEKLDRMEATQYPLACGNLYDETFVYTSKENYLWLQFKSDAGNVTATGFNITYEIVSAEVKNTGIDTDLIIGIGAAAVFCLILLILIIAIVVCLKKRSKRRSSQANQPLGLAFAGPYDVTIDEGLSTFAETIANDNNYDSGSGQQDNTRIYHVINNTEPHEYASTVNRAQPIINQDGRASSSGTHYEYSIVEHATGARANNRNNNTEGWVENGIYSSD